MDSTESDVNQKLSELTAAFEATCAQAESLGYTLHLVSRACVAISYSEEEPTTAAEVSDPLLLVESPRLSDVTLVLCTGEGSSEQIHAHKELLQPRSKYFENLFASGFSETDAPVIQMSPPYPSLFKILLPYLYAEVETEAMLSDEHIVGVAANAEYLLLPARAQRTFMNLLAAKWRGALSADPNGFKLMPSTVMEHVMERLSNRGDGGLEAFVFLASIGSKQSVEMVPKLFSIERVRDTLGYKELKKLFKADGKKVAAWDHHAAVIPAQQLFGCMENEMMQQKIAEDKIQEMLNEELEAARDLMKCKQCGKVMTREHTEMVLSRKGDCTEWYHPGKYHAGTDHGWTCCGEPYKKCEGCKALPSQHKFEKYRFY
ncbi:unnamed protein product [Chrysoparadoxa australica]